MINVDSNIRTILFVTITGTHNWLVSEDGGCAKREIEETRGGIINDENELRKYSMFDNYSYKYIASSDPDDAICYAQPL